MIQKLQKYSAQNNELLNVLNIVKEGMLLIIDDTGNTGHNAKAQSQWPSPTRTFSQSESKAHPIHSNYSGHKTEGAGTPTSPDHLKVEYPGGANAN